VQRVQRVQFFGAVRGCSRPSCNACNALGQSEVPAGLRATRGMLWGRLKLRQAFLQRVECIGAVRGCGRPCCNERIALGRSEVPAGLLSALLDGQTTQHASVHPFGTVGKGPARSSCLDLRQSEKLPSLSRALLKCLNGLS
jgi:hypothetical protein